MKKIVIFGAKEFEDRLKDLIELNTDDRVVAFCVDRPYLECEERNGCPVVPSDVISDIYSINEVEFLVGIGYKDMNDLRMRKYLDIKEKGYHFYNFIHRQAYIDPTASIGDNNIILGNAFIDYKARVGNCNIIETGVSISHESEIGNYNYFSPRVVMGGKTHIKDSCFIGLGAIVRSATTVGSKALVGAGAYVDRDVESDSVIVPAKSKKISYRSTEMNILYKGDKKWEEC